MGGLWSKLFGGKELKILMIGLDAAGKTTILYKLKFGNVITTIPTIGFNVETVNYKKIRFNVWDVGGQERIRPLWRHYFPGTRALVFVIDSTDIERINDAFQELHRLLKEPAMESVALLIYANKQDLSNALQKDQITEELQLKRLDNKHLWHVEPCCALTGEGLFEGLSWLSDTLKDN